MRGGAFILALVLSFTTTAPGQIESRPASTPLSVTVLPVTLEPDNVPPGAAVKMTYTWHASHSYTATVHIWHPEPHRSLGTTITTQRYQASTGFHRYGCRVDPQWITSYFDGIEVWHAPTPPEHNKPLMILLNLALGPGWPIDKTPNPSVMEVDYVRAYTLPEENH